MHFSTTFAAALAAVAGTLAAAQDTTPSGPHNATVETFTLPACNGAIRLGKKHRWSMAPDSCLSVSTSSSFRIEEAAVCANGTRARLARYEGRGCNGGVVTADDGIVDLVDGDLGGKCFGIQPDSAAATGASYASFSFFCDGRTASGGGDDSKDSKPAPPPSKAKKGSVSHNICPARSQSGMRAPTFRHPMPDTCMGLPAGQPLKVLSAATCPDGTEARLATWSGPNCPGIVPGALEPLADDQVDECMLWDADETSYAFWCSGDIKRGGASEAEKANAGPPGSDRKEYNIVGLILVMFLIGSVGILVFAFALLRWAAVANKVMVSGV
jgi:hypothetical protein